MQKIPSGQGWDEKRLFEERSSAVTLSDMEIFVFPDLMFSLVLANIMSPRIWKWRDDPWFDGIERMSPYRRVIRLKQYVMDHYTFNLDLDTWGLTTKRRELARFRDYVDPAVLAESNALFGYEGDRYYFDIDIRRHFGLDKYGGDVIPYWKTETVEAMDAFRHKPGHTTGAGECVSLSTLYAAALFIVARIPLNDIFLMATPLHSQNFVDVEDGILTNNRRLVTRNMWFNGTALSAQARRALENEQVTIVTHESGRIHTVYREATIDPAAYSRFVSRIGAFLSADLTDENLGNSLRHSSDIQRCFQLRWRRHGADCYIGVERVIAYERSNPFRFNDRTRDKLMAEIETEEFSSGPLPSRIVLNDLEDFVRTARIDIRNSTDVARLKERFSSSCLSAEIALESLLRFLHTAPQLPDVSSKTFSAWPPLGLDTEMSREEIEARIRDLRGRNPFADLAFYAWRDLLSTDAGPFLMAAVRRNPVSIEASGGMKDADAASRVAAFENESVYDGPGRLAQPDEVWNYARGDGVEKALLLANILRARRSQEEISVGIDGRKVLVKAGRDKYDFATEKGLPDTVWRIGPGAGEPG
jgi:hypothetical protein